MKTTINQSQFVDAFTDMNRKDNFSYNGLVALYDYLLDLERDLGDEWELDVIALCCNFSEFKDLADVQAQYDQITSMEVLQDHTQVIEFDGGLIIQQF